MRVRVLGGSGEQGRACFAVAEGEAVLLLDAGVKRTPFAPPRETYPRFDLLPAAPRAVVVSHAHEDHAAALPLVPATGRAGVPIYATAATAADARVYCRGWSRTVASAGQPAPYTERDVERLEFRPLEHGTTSEVCGTFRVGLGAAGHLPGSAWILVEAGGRRLLYTGDWAAESLLLRPPAFPGDVDAVLLDAAYGAAAWAQAAVAERLLGRAQETTAGGGVALLPLPRLGRSQEILLLLAQEAHRLAPIWVAAAIVDALVGYRAARELTADGRRRLAAFDPGRVRVFESPDEVPDTRPGVVLAPDGMLSGGPSVPILERLAPDPRNSVVLTGHQAAGTLGERLLREPPAAGRGCRVELLVWKVHPDRLDRERFLGGLQGRPRIFPVHAEPASAEAVARMARARGFPADVLAVGEERPV